MKDAGKFCKTEINALPVCKRNDHVRYRKIRKWWWEVAPAAPPCFNSICLCCMGLIDFNLRSSLLVQYSTVIDCISVTQQGLKVHASFDKLEPNRYYGCAQWNLFFLFFFDKMFSVFNMKRPINTTSSRHAGHPVATQRSTLQELWMDGK